MARGDRAAMLDGLTAPAKPQIPPAVPVTTAPPAESAERPAVKRPWQGAAAGALVPAVGRVKQALEAELSRGAADTDEGRRVIEIDPADIDNGGIADRLEIDGEGFDQFVDVIREQGQLVPILVRQVGDPGRYQVVYGRRRIAAAKRLGIKVRAIVRALSDDEVIIAQGQENSARTNLSFIERARFASHLYARFKPALILSALGIDKAMLSRMRAVTEAVPDEIIVAIGPAHKAGRRTWEQLAELLKVDGAVERAREVVSNPIFRRASSDARFDQLVAALREPPEKKGKLLVTPEGRALATRKASGRSVAIVFSPKETGAFVDFVERRLEALYREFKEQGA
jgi:ParB family transcriptional regulator, chromosome partitioning protein